MFLVAAIEDKLRTLPDAFDRPPAEVLIEQIELKYANRVVQDVGLCISFYDFVHVGDPYVYAAEGSSHQHVKFRLVVFRPFAGEIICGRILSSSKEGVRITLGFFDDVLVPPHLMQQPSKYDAARNVWVWDYDEEGDGSTGAFVMGKGEEVRFKVRTIRFTTVTNTVKERRTSIAAEGQTEQGGGMMRRRSASSVGLAEHDPAAMQLIASVCEDGLGLVSWWR